MPEKKMTLKDSPSVASSQLEEYRQAVGQTLPRNLPISEDILRSWKMVLTSLEHSLSETSSGVIALASLLTTVSGSFDDDFPVFRPEIHSVQNSEVRVLLAAYADFITAMTNLFLNLITKNLGQRRSPDILLFYSKLVTFLYSPSRKLHIPLVKKFIICLDTILDSYKDSSLDNIDIILNTFVVDSREYMVEGFAPDRSVQPLSINTLKEAQRIITFISVAIFNSLEFLNDCKVQEKAVNVLLKRFSLFEKFGVSEILKSSMLTHQDFARHPQLIMILDQMMCKIHEGTTNNVELKTEISKLELQILNVVLRYPCDLCQNLKMVYCLRDTHVKIALGTTTLDDLSELRLKVFTKLVRSSPGFLTLTPGQVKLFATEFCAADKMVHPMPLNILLAYMESELRTALPQAVTTYPKRKSQEPNQKHQHVCFWMDAGDNSMVWKIFKDLSLLIIQRIGMIKQTQNISEMKAGEIMRDMVKIHAILKGVSILSCKIDKLQIGNSVRNLFHFFDGIMGVVVRNLAAMPVFCLKYRLTGNIVPRVQNQEIREADLWRMTLESINYTRHLPELVKLQQKDLSLLETLSGLLWFKLDLKKKPIFDPEHSELIESVSAKLEERFGYCKNWPVITRTDENTCTIMEYFFKGFHETKGQVTSWRAGVLRHCLKLESCEFKAISIKHLPFVLSACHKEDIPNMLNCLEDIKETNDLSVALALAQTLPLIACAISGCCSVYKEISEDSDRISIKLVCNKCDNHNITNVNKRKLENFTVNWKWIIQHKDSRVRKLIAVGFKRINNHLYDTFRPSDINIWMKLLVDAEFEVSMNFAPHVGLFVKNPNDQELDKKFETIINEFKHAILWSLGKKEQHRHSVIIAIDCFNKIAPPVEYVSMTKLLILLILTADTDCEISETMVEALAKTHNLTTKMLFWHSDDDIWGILIHFLESVEPANRDIIKYLQRFVKMFDLGEQAFKNQLHRLLGLLIIKSVSDHSFYSQLTKVGKYIGRRMLAIISDWYPLLYCRIVLDDTVTDVDTVLEWLSIQMQRTKGNALESGYKLIISTLCVDISTEFEKVVMHIERVYKYVEPKKNVPYKQIILNHFHGTLITIENIIGQKYARNDIKSKAINSLAKLIDILGGNLIEPYHNKLLDMMCTYSNSKEFCLAKAYCNLVFSFIKSLDEDQLVQVALIPVSNLLCLDWNILEYEIKQILDYIIKEAPVKNALTDVCYIGDMLIHFGYNEYIENLPSQKFEEKSKLILKLLNSPKEINQQLGLYELKMMASKSQEDILKILNGSREEQVQWKNILGKLFELCCAYNSKICNVALEIIGMIGAINPRHSLVSYGFQSQSVFYLDSSSPVFVAASFEILVEELQSASTSNEMDVIGLICQELMKAHDFQDEPSKAPVEIWSLLTPASQVILTPFFKSKYIQSNNAIQQKSNNFLDDASDDGKQFNSWLYRWVCRLISMIKNKKAQASFSAMKLLFQINSKCMLFFLPQIFLNAIWSANKEEIKIIVQEMRTAAGISDIYDDYLEKSYDSLEKVLNSLDRPCDMHNFTHNVKRSTLNVKCSQLILHLIDFMMQWVVEFEKAKQSDEGKRKDDVFMKHDHAAESQDTSKKPSKCSTTDHRYDVIKGVLASFNMVSVAEVSHMCNDTFRGLRYLEVFAIDNMRKVPRFLDLFLQICTYLNDIDLTIGVASALESKMSITENLLLYEMNGEYQKAILCYENLHKKEATDKIKQNMAKAFLGLEDFHAAIALIEQTTKNCINIQYSAKPSMQEKYRSRRLHEIDEENYMLSIQLEVLWKMQEWETLEKVIMGQPRDSQTWATHIAIILLHLHSGSTEEALASIQQCRNVLGMWLHLSDFKSGLYTQNYFAFLIIHILTEMEWTALHIHFQIQNKDDHEQIQEALNKMLVYFKSRQLLSCPHWRYLQQILSMRRTLLTLMYKHVDCNNRAKYHEIKSFIRKEIADLWIESSKLAISFKQFPQALAYANHAESCDSKEAFIVKAMIDWESGNKENALIFLKQGIKANFPPEPSYKAMRGKDGDPTRVCCAKAKYLVADYSTRLFLVSPVDSLRLHKEAVAAYPYIEDNWVHYGRSWKSLNIDMYEIETDEKSLSILKEIVKAYSNAMMCGVKHIFESLPTIITIWANVGLVMHKVDMGIMRINSDEKEKLNTTFKQFQDTIATLLRDVPLYVFYVCFYHINARLCHPYFKVYNMIQQIMVKLLDKFPHQMLWRLVPTVKIHQSSRSARILKIFEIQQKKNASFHAMVQDYYNLSDLLYKFGFCQARSTKTQPMSALAPKLQSFCANRSGKILIPLNKFMTAKIPSEHEDYTTFDPFDKVQYVYIARVKDEVMIIQSLQKPKRFVFVGTDGEDYPWLLKVKDDLRIDNMVMQFMQALNSLFELEPECKQRGLTCRTYSVVPIGDDCGLIEWVPNLVPLRETIINTYKRMGLKTGGRKELKKEHTAEEMRMIFEKYWLPTHPPVLGHWYAQQFTDDAAWYEARRQFIQTSAVMSMVGYILGLGDRHGGNIMIDETTGQVLHVDFNCIFNKNENLPWPEKVPFRLTQNMVGAMGATGLDGTFLRVCELSLKVIRNNMHTMISIVKPVLYDAVKRDRQENIEEPKEEFVSKLHMKSIRRIHTRMSGHLNDKDTERTPSGTPFSPEGQAAAVIKLAKDIKNLSQMYPGWGAFM